MEVKKKVLCINIAIDCSLMNEYPKVYSCKQ